LRRKKQKLKSVDKVDILKKSENLSLDPLSLNEILNTIDPLNEMRDIRSKYSF
jgi:hypothetical protein